MKPEKEIESVINAFKAYCKGREEMKHIKKIPEFCFPTPFHYPHPEVKKVLENKGFTHRNGRFGVGYYADNIK